MKPNQKSKGKNEKSKMKPSATLPAKGIFDFCLLIFDLPFLLVGLGRVELPTSPLSGVRSSHLSYRPNPCLGTGGAGRDRTGDLLNANQALSQLSYSPKKSSRPIGCRTIRLQARSPL